MNKEFTEAFIEELSKQAALPAIFAKYLPKMTKFLTRFPRTVKGFYKGFASIPGMPRWRAGLKALKFGTKLAPRSAIPYYGGAGALGLGGLRTISRKLRTKKGEEVIFTTSSKKGGIVDKETCYIKGFEKELEKIGIAGLGKMLGIGTLAFGAGASLGVLGGKKIKSNIIQSHKATQKAVNLARKSAGKKWAKMTPLQRAQLMSIYLGPGKGKAEYRKNLLSKIK